MARTTRANQSLAPLGRWRSRLNLLRAQRSREGRRQYAASIGVNSDLQEVTVVVDPALDVRSKHPREICQGFVGPMVQRPPSDRLPNCLQQPSDWPLAGRKCRNDYRASTSLLSDERRSRENQTTGPESRHAGSYPLAIDELRLRRMENQSAGPEADFQSIPEPAGFFFASAVADDVVRVSSKGMEGKLRAIQVSKA